ncbi:hypothetical protein BU26DRAFT_515630 [Trematosphaeria pertusa]|uniref:Peptidase C14 caspase domain-containing protein n=1 Tax=Trematosphaeria pertusa TaxID=390896 RepID=A0A6A6ITQ7_9PLEO|nr:uncharacterized protein BU26DRAFT_515630 [Trematosphaeria pertusa]KAF2253262.1 hypothetical protein BU26DRAFT_515630 [Trematosphaeria pertusa]
MVGWAVLVGVDYYPDGKAQLRGCVQDVEDLYELLCDTYCFHSSRIFKLISVRPAATLALGTNPSATPTYHNIIRTIQDIEDNAQAGDHIYIHFSCRTGRAPSIIPSDRRCYDTKELVLLPADHEATKKFLHELELAVLLRSLTSKGLEVTLIIDGRFSLDSETPVERRPSVIRRFSYWSHRNRGPFLVGQSGCSGAVHRCYIRWLTGPVHPERILG